MKSSRERFSAIPVCRDDISLQTAELFYDSMDSGLAEFVRGKSFFALVDQPLPPVDLDVDTFRDEYWMAESWSKFPFLIPGVDRDAAAKQSFYDGEVRCYKSNAALTDYFSRPRPEKFRRCLREARRRLHSVLGGITPAEVMHRAAWGPGATVGLRRARSSHQHKWELAAHTTQLALPWVADLWRYAALPEREFRVVDSNMVTTVPKNAKTNRVIAIEPDWNVFFQKGLGSAISARLQKRCGLLHKTAQSRNKNLARVGSAGGGFSTIDLKGASDSVSLALCELLLPADLCKILLSLRSPYGTIDGKRVEYEKVSSMGNASTFELETALFWAISSSISGDAAVYGDDIIVPDACASDVIDLLREVGFEVNEKKTHIAGPFRESCGGHFYNGVDVTPPYFRKELNSIPQRIASANRLSERCTRHGYRDARFKQVWDLLSRPVPRHLWGPASAGDKCLHMPFDAVRPRFHRGFQSFQCIGISKKRRMAPAPEWGRLQAALHGDTHVERYPSEEEVLFLSKFYTDRWVDEHPWM